jgi:hypothetical protein
VVLIGLEYVSSIDGLAKMSGAAMILTAPVGWLSKRDNSQSVAVRKISYLPW